MAITFWHNPRCSKSRAALSLLLDAGADVTLRRYLDDPPKLGDVRHVARLLNRPALDMVRTKEPEFKALGLGADADEATLLAALAHTPRLLERPIAMAGTRAAIGRPPEAVLDLLQD